MEKSTHRISILNTRDAGEDVFFSSLRIKTCKTKSRAHQRHRLVYKHTRLAYGPHYLLIHTIVFSKQRSRVGFRFRTRKRTTSKRSCGHCFQSAARRRHTIYARRLAKNVCVDDDPPRKVRVVKRRDRAPPPKGRDESKLRRRTAACFPPPCRRRRTVAADADRAKHLFGND